MPTSGWDLNILINAKLNPASLNTIRNKLQNLSRVLSVGPDFGEQVRKNVEEGAKKAQLDVSTEHIARSVSGALSAMSNMLIQVNTALKNVESVMAKGAPIAKTPGAKEAPPTARVAASPEQFTQQIRENLKQAEQHVSTIADAMGVSLQEGVARIGDAAKQSALSASQEAAERIGRESLSATKAIQMDFVEMFRSIVARTKKGTVDIGAIRAIPDIRALAGVHAEARAKKGKGLRRAAGFEQVERALEQFVSETNDDFKLLAARIVQLTNVMDEGTAVPAQRIASLMSDIKALSSKGSGRRVAVGTGLTSRFNRATEEFVETAFGNIMVAMLSELDRLEQNVVSVASLTGKTKDEEKAIKTKMQSATDALGRYARQVLEFFHVVEQSGRYNINIPRLGPPGGGGRGRRGPFQRIPEAEFLNVTGQRAAEMLQSRPRALKGLEVAVGFEKIKDVVDRTNKVFDVMFDRMDISGEEFKKDMMAVVGALRMMGERDPVNRQEIEQTAKALDKYVNQLIKLESQLKRVPGAEGATFRVPQVAGGPAASRREVFRTVQQIRQAIAKEGQRGIDIPINVQYADAAGNLRKLQLTMRKTGETMEHVRIKVNKEIRQMAPREVMGQAFRRVAVWGMAAGIIYGGVSALRDALRVMLETETGLISLAKVMREADIDFRGFSSRVQDFAKTTAIDFGTSIKSVYEAMRIFGQQGMNLAQTQDMVKATAVAANVSILTQAEAAEALTAATRQFNMEASQAMSVVDAWNEIANRNAVTVKTLADATKKAGAAAKTVGLEYEQFLGLVTAIGTATRQPGKEIGTSLRFIFQRTLRPETEKTLAKYGVATRNLMGDFKGFIPLITDIADRWDTLSKSQKLAIGQALGGARQYNVFLALMNNYGLAIKATNDAINSNGSAMDENQKVMGTAAKKFEQMRASLHNLYISFGNEFLPVLKEVTDGIRGMIDWFGGIDSSMKKVIATIGILTIASTRLAVQFDYLMMGGMGGGAVSAGGGILGLLSGRGLSKDQIGTMPLEKMARLTPTALMAKEFSDFGKSSQGVAKELSAVSGKIVDINKIAVSGTQNMSKLGLAVRNYGVLAEGAATASYIGFTSLNSPLSKLALMLTKLGKAPFIFLLSTVPNLAARAASSIGLLNKTTATTIGLQMRARIASLGWAGSIGLLTLTAIGAAWAFGKLWKAMTSRPKQRFTGEETERKLQSEIAKREKVLKQTKQQMAWMSRLERDNMKFAKADMYISKNKDKLSAKDIQKRKDDLLLGRTRLAQATKEAGAYILRVNPAMIKSIDEYGNAFLRTEVSLKEMSKAAVSAKAHIAALSRIDVASGYAKDVSERLKDVRKAMTGITDLTPGMQAMAAVFGDVGAAGQEYSEVVDNLQTKIISYKAAVTSVIEALKKIPKEAPLESFLSALARTDIRKVLQFDADQFNAQMKSMQGGMTQTATAADKMNQIFLQRKGIRDAGILGDQTAAILRGREVFSTTLKQMQSEGRKFAGGELIVWEKQRGPFGLTQAWVAVDEEGNKVIEGIGKFGQKVRERVDDLRGDVGKATIFDTRKLVQEANESILNAAKQISGAGAGIIKFPAQLELGTKFKFELPGLDRLQLASKQAASVLRDAFIAQRAYTSSVSEHVKQAKTAAGTRLATVILEQLNELGRSASLKTFVVRIMTEVDALAKGFEKAAYDLQKANLADEIERQFAESFGAISGFSKLSIDLPKLQSERTAGERLAATSPDLAIAVKTASRSVESVKQLMVGFRTMSQLDLPRMMEGMAAKDRRRFTEDFVKNQKNVANALKETGGDKRFAAVVKANVDVKSSIEKQTSHLGGLLEKIAGIERERVGVDTGPANVKQRANLAAAKKWEQRLLAQITPDLKYLVSPPATEVEQKSTKKTLVTGSDIIKSEFLPQAAELGREFRKLKEQGITEVPDALAKKLQQAHIASFEKATAYAESKGVQISKGRKEVSRKFPLVGDWLQKEVPGVGPAINALNDAFTSIFLGPKKELDKLQKAQEIMLRKLSEGHLQVIAAPLEAYKKIISGAATSIEQEGVPTIARKPMELRDLNLRMADLVDAAMLDFKRAMAKTGEQLLSVDAKRLVALERMLKTLGRAASETTGFAYAVQKATKDLINMSKQAEVFASLEAPIAGAGAGILAAPELGKLKGELSPFERVAKQVPELARATSLQEQARKSLISTSKSLYKQMLDSSGKINELIAGAKTPEQASRLRSYLQSLQEMGGGLVKAVTDANTASKPFVETLSKLVHLEKVKVSLEGIINELRKMEDLEFDTTSIDIALGKHPLSPTPGVYGQPAGLDKFARKEYEIRQKMYAPGGVSRDEMASLQLQKKRNEFAREEALIQYKQNKENQKLAAEVNAAKRAMGILWDAQYKGIGGLEPLISTIKGELESAGDITRGVGGRREFRGVPSVHGMQREIAKIQERVQAKRFAQQRDIVMQPLVDINKEMAAKLDEIKTVLEKDTKETLEKGVGGDSAKSILDRFNKLSQAIQQFTNTGIQVLTGMSEAIKKTELKGGKDLSGFKTLDENMKQFGSLLGKGSDSMKGAVDKFDVITKVLEDITEKVKNINKNLVGGAKFIPAGKNVIPTKYFGGVIKPVQRFQHGGEVGVVGGVSGIDKNITSVPANSFILRKKAMDDLGGEKGLLELAGVSKSSTVSGTGSRGGEPVALTKGEGVVYPEAAKRIGYKRLREVNKGINRTSVDANGVPKYAFGGLTRRLSAGTGVSWNLLRSGGSMLRPEDLVLPQSEFAIKTGKASTLDKTAISINEDPSRVRLTSTAAATRVSGKGKLTREDWKKTVKNLTESQLREIYSLHSYEELKRSQTLNEIRKNISDETVANIYRNVDKKTGAGAKLVTPKFADVLNSDGMERLNTVLANKKVSEDQKGKLIESVYLNPKYRLRQSMDMGNMTYPEGHPKAGKAVFVVKGKTVRTEEDVKKYFGNDFFIENGKLKRKFTRDSLRKDFLGSASKAEFFVHSMKDKAGKKSLNVLLSREYDKTSYQGRNMKRISYLRSQYDKYLSGDKSVDYTGLFAMSQGVVPSKYVSDEDKDLIRALQSGYTNVKSYKASKEGFVRMQDVKGRLAQYEVSAGGGYTDQPSPEELKKLSAEASKKGRAGPLQARDALINLQQSSKQSLVDWIQDKDTVSRIRSNELARAGQVFSKEMKGAKTKGAKEKAFKWFLFRQKLGSQQIAKERAEMAVMLNMISPWLRNEYSVSNMEYYGADDEGRGKATRAAVNVNLPGGGTSTLTTYSDEKGRRFLVSQNMLTKIKKGKNKGATRLKKAGELDYFKTEEGKYNVKGFMIPIDELKEMVAVKNKTTGKTTTFSAEGVLTKVMNRTGGFSTRRLEGGKLGAGVPVMIGMDKFGEPIYRSSKQPTPKDLTTFGKEYSISNETDNEIKDRMGYGKGTFTDRLAGWAAYTVSSTIKGVEQMGKLSAQQWKEGNYADATLGTWAVQPVGGMATNLGLNLGALTEKDVGVTGMKYNKHSVLYGIGEKVRKARGLDAKSWDPTLESVFDFISDVGSFVIPGGTAGRIFKVMAGPRHLMKAGRYASSIKHLRKFFSGPIGKHFLQSAGYISKNVKSGMKMMATSGSRWRGLGKAAKGVTLGGAGAISSIPLEMAKLAISGGKRVLDDTKYQQKIHTKNKARIDRIAAGNTTLRDKMFMTYDAVASRLGAVDSWADSMKGRVKRNVWGTSEWHADRPFRQTRRRMHDLWKESGGKQGWDPKAARDTYGRPVDRAVGQSAMSDTYINQTISKLKRADVSDLADDLSKPPPPSVLDPSRQAIKGAEVESAAKTASMEASGLVGEDRVVMELLQQRRNIMDMTRAELLQNARTTVVRDLLNRAIEAGGAPGASWWKRGVGKGAEVGRFFMAKKLRGEALRAWELGVSSKSNLARGSLFGRGRGGIFGPDRKMQALLDASDEAPLSTFTPREYLDLIDAPKARQLAKEFDSSWAFTGRRKRAGTAIDDYLAEHGGREKIVSNARTRYTERQNAQTRMHEFMSTKELGDLPMSKLLEIAEPSNWLERLSLKMLRVGRKSRFGKFTKYGAGIGALGVGGGASLGGVAAGLGATSKVFGPLAPMVHYGMMGGMAGLAGAGALKLLSAGIGKLWKGRIARRLGGKRGLRSAIGKAEASQVPAAVAQAPTAITQDIWKQLDDIAGSAPASVVPGKAKRVDTHLLSLDDTPFDKVVPKAGQPPIKAPTNKQVLGFHSMLEANDIMSFKARAGAKTSLEAGNITNFELGLGRRLAPDEIRDVLKYLSTHPGASISNALSVSGGGVSKKVTAKARAAEAAQTKAAMKEIARVREQSFVANKIESIRKGAILQSQGIIVPGGTGGGGAVSGVIGKRVEVPTRQIRESASVSDVVVKRAEIETRIRKAVEDSEKRKAREVYGPPKSTRELFDETAKLAEAKEMAKRVAQPKFGMLAREVPDIGLGPAKRIPKTAIEIMDDFIDGVVDKYQMRHLASHFKSQSRNFLGTGPLNKAKLAQMKDGISKAVEALAAREGIIPGVTSVPRQFDVKEATDIMRERVKAMGMERAVEILSDLDQTSVKRSFGLPENAPLVLPDIYAPGDLFNMLNKQRSRAFDPFKMSSNERAAFLLSVAEYKASLKGLTGRAMKKHHGAHATGSAESILKDIDDIDLISQKFASGQAVRLNWEAMTDIERLYNRKLERLTTAPDEQAVSTFIKNTQGDIDFYDNLGNEAFRDSLPVVLPRRLRMDLGEAAHIFDINNASQAKRLVAEITQSQKRHIYDQLGPDSAILKSLPDDVRNYLLVYYANKFPLDPAAPRLKPRVSTDQPDVESQPPTVQAKNLYSGGKIQKFQDGGEVKGRGGPRSDLEHIMASPGEYILKKDAVDKLRARYGPDFLDKLNSGNIQMAKDGDKIKKLATQKSFRETYRSNISLPYAEGYNAVLNAAQKLNISKDQANWTKEQKRAYELLQMIYANSSLIDQKKATVVEGKVYLTAPTGGGYKLSDLKEVLAALTQGGEPVVKELFGLKVGPPPTAEEKSEDIKEPASKPILSKDKPKETVASVPQQVKMALAEAGAKKMAQAAAKGTFEKPDEKTLTYGKELIRLSQSSSSDDRNKIRKELVRIAVNKMMPQGLLFGTGPSGKGLPTAKTASEFVKNLEEGQALLKLAASPSLLGKSVASKPVQKTVVSGKTVDPKALTKGSYKKQAVSMYRKFDPKVPHVFGYSGDAPGGPGSKTPAEMGGRTAKPKGGATGYVPTVVSYEEYSALTSAVGERTQPDKGRFFDRMDVDYPSNGYDDPITIQTPDGGLLIGPSQSELDSYRRAVGDRGYFEYKKEHDRAFRKAFSSSPPAAPVGYVPPSLQYLNQFGTDEENRPKGPGGAVDKWKQPFTIYRSLAGMDVEDARSSTKKVVQVYQKGGVVGGSGSDGHLIMAHSGEYVLNKDASDKLKSRFGSDFLDKLNSGNIPGFQNGGEVDPLARRGKLSTQDVLLAKRGKLEGTSEIENNLKELSDVLVSGVSKIVTDTINVVKSKVKTEPEPVGPGSGDVVPYDTPPVTRRGLDIKSGGVAPDVATKVSQKSREPSGPGSGDVIPNTDDITKAILEGFKGALDKAEVDISADSIAQLKASMEESAAVIKSNLEEASFDSLGDALKTAIADTEVAISTESISSMGRAIVDAASSIERAIQNAAPTVTTQQGNQVTGLGAAVRPEVIEELSGRVDILKEDFKTSILELETEFTTTLNERLSGISEQAVKEVRDLYEPKFVETETSISRVDADVKTITGLIHTIRSTMVPR